MSPSKPTRSRRVALWRYSVVWLSVFTGGAMVGMGVFLVAQILLIHDIRTEVVEIGGLRRTLGKMTFLWRGLDQKLALALEEIPAEYLDHSQTAGMTVAWIGLAGFAVLVPAVLFQAWRLRR